MGNKRDSPSGGRSGKFRRNPTKGKIQGSLADRQKAAEKVGFRPAPLGGVFFGILRVCDNRINRTLAGTAMSSAVIRVTGRSYRTGGSPWDLGEVLIHELYDQLASLNENLAIVVIEFVV
jgi:hypothetical protein